MSKAWVASWGSLVVILFGMKSRLDEHYIVLQQQYERDIVVLA